MKFINKPLLLENNLGDRSMVQFIVNMFWDEEIQQDILQAYELLQNNGSIEEIQSIVHKIKPSFSYVGLFDMYDQIENAYRSLANKEGDTHSHIQSLKQILNIIIPILTT